MDSTISVPLPATVAIVGLALVGALTVLAAPADAAAGGPDRAGYVYVDSLSPGGPAYDFEDLSETGRALDVDDRDRLEGPVPIGFGFRFYGQVHEDVYVSERGFLSFEDPGSAALHHEKGIPSPQGPDAMIAGAYQSFLHAGDEGQLHVATRGEPGDRVFIAQYTGFQRHAWISGEPEHTPVSFQVKLFEADDRIEVHYKTVGPGLEANWGALAGIENPEGTVGLEYGQGPQFARAQTAVRYERYEDRRTAVDTTFRNRVGDGEARLRVTVWSDGSGRHPADVPEPGEGDDLVRVDVLGREVVRLGRSDVERTREHAEAVRSDPAFVRVVARVDDRVRVDRMVVLPAGDSVVAGVGAVP